MKRHCTRKFRAKGGVMRCAKWAGGGKGRRKKSGKRKGRRGLQGLSGDVAKCINYAKTKNGLWRCLMEAHGPGNPLNRPKTKRKYSYNSPKARRRRQKHSKLNFRTQTKGGQRRTA